MKLEHLGFLLVVADCGSISKAAEQLHISQPSLSSAISNIEDTYNIHLFIRTRTGIEITERGQLFLSRVRNVQKSLDELDNFANLTLQGVLKVASVPGINASIMPSIISSFSSKHPLVRVEVEEMGSLAVRQQIDNNICDVGLCSSRDMAEIDKSKYYSHKLISGRVMACMTPAHSLANYQKLSVKDIVGYPIVLFNKNFRSYSFIVNLLEEYEVPNIILTTSNSELAKQTIMKSNSLGFFSNLLLSNDPYISTGKLLAIPLAEEKGTDFILLQKRERINHQISQAFIEEIKSQSNLFNSLNF